MANMYAATFAAQALTATQDLFELIVPATKVVVVHEIRLGQTSDVGDSAEEILQILIKRGVSSTSGNTGSAAAATPSKLQTGDSTAGCTFDANNTVKMSAGTITTLGVYTWNVRGEFLYLPVPEARIVLSPSERLTVEMSAPADSITTNGTLLFEEIG